MKYISHLTVDVDKLPNGKEWKISPVPSFTILKIQDTHFLLLVQIRRSETSRLKVPKPTIILFSQPRSRFALSLMQHTHSPYEQMQLNICTEIFRCSHIVYGNVQTGLKSIICAHQTKQGVKTLIVFILTNYVSAFA